MTDGLYDIYTHGRSGVYAYTCIFVYTHMYASASLVCARVCIHIHEIMRSDGLVSLDEVCWGRGRNLFSIPETIRHGDQTTLSVRLFPFMLEPTRCPAAAADCCSCRPAEKI